MSQRLSAVSHVSAYHKSAIRTSLSLALSKFNTFCTETSYQGQERDNVKKFSNLLIEDDEFSELGAPVTKNGFSMLKLRTEKPNPFMKSGRSKDVSQTKSDSVTSIKELFSTLDNPRKNVDTNTGNSAAASRTNENTRDQSHVKKQGVLQGGMGNSNSVAVENVPTSVSLPTVVEPPKNVAAASRTNESTCNQSHVALHGGSQNVTLRIQGLSHDTSLDMIHSFIKSVGCLEEIAIKHWGSVQAVFRVKADSDLEDILKKLNGAVIDKRRITADILQAHDNAPVAPISRGKRNKMGLQVSSDLKELHNQFNLHAIYAEDLHNLHLAIMHLESQSGTLITDSSLTG